MLLFPIPSTSKYLLSINYFFMIHHTTTYRSHHITYNRSIGFIHKLHTNLCHCTTRSYLNQPSKKTSTRSTQNLNDFCQTRLIKRRHLRTEGERERNTEKGKLINRKNQDSEKMKKKMKQEKIRWEKSFYRKKRKKNDGKCWKGKNVRRSEVFTDDNV